MSALVTVCLIGLGGRVSCQPRWPYVVSASVAVCRVNLGGRLSCVVSASVAMCYVGLSGRVLGFSGQRASVAMFYVGLRAWSCVGLGGHM